jgi:hypothetical protein
MCVWQDTVRVKAAAPTFLYCALLGCVLGFLGLVATAVDELNSSASLWAFSCSARNWLLSLGFVLVVASLIAKTCVHMCICAYVRA